MNETIKSLYNEDHTALKQLHNTHLINFCAPLDAFTIKGRFTVNQITKAAAAIGHTPSTSRIIVCVSGVKYRDNDIFTAEITAGGGVKIDFKYHSYSNGRWMQSKIDYFCRKSDFDEYRKQDGITAFILCQNKNDLTKENPHPVNLESRFKIENIRRWCYQLGGQDYIGEIETRRTDDNGSRYTYNERGMVIYRGRNEYVEIGELIDKSGYIVNRKRDELTRRAAALRAEREKAAYIKTDNAAIIAELDKLYQQARAAIIEELNTAGTVEEYKTIAKKLDYFHGIADALDDLERLKSRDAAREYSSIERFTAAANAIRAKFEALTA